MIGAAMRNCTRDEGGPFEVGNQVLISSHRRLLSSKAMVVSVAETAGQDPVREGWESCAIKQSCTTGKERRITRWEHEHILEAVQRRLDEHPEKMRERRETVEHPFGTIKARMGATHFLMKTLPRVAAEMALHVLAYNLTRVMKIIGVQPLMAAMRA
jgi:hypothetical protein